MMRSETAWVRRLTHLPLTFVYYSEPECPGVVGAHCLELDLGGQGTTRAAATEDLKAAIETYVLHVVDGNEDLVARPADPEMASIADQERFLLTVVSMKLKRVVKQELFFSMPPTTFQGTFATA